MSKISELNTTIAELNKKVEELQEVFNGYKRFTGMNFKPHAKMGGEIKILHKHWLFLMVNTQTNGTQGWFNLAD